VGRATRLDTSAALDYIREHISLKAIDNHRRPLEQEWIRSVAFLHGKQHFVYDNGRLRNPNLPPHKVLYKANLIRGALTRAVATVMANRVTFQSPARDWSKASRDRSIVSTKLFDHLRKTLRWQSRMKGALNWAGTCGSGFIELYWDPNGGSPERIYIQDKINKRAQLGLTPEEQKQKEEEGLFEDETPGEIRADGVPPFQHQWDWSAREEGIDGCSWIGRKQLIDIEILEEVFGHAKTKDIKPMEPDSEGTYFEELLAFMASSFSQPITGFVTPREKRQHQTIYSQIYEKPMAKNGYRGRYIAAAGDTLLMNNDNPYLKCEKDFPGMCLPVLKVDWQIKPGSYIGQGLVPELISAQFQYNKARATVIEAQNIFGHPAMFVPKNSDIPTGMLSIEPGMVYEYNTNTGAQKPIELGPVPNLPKEVTENAAQALREIQMISSQSDPDSSKLPGQIRGAPAMELMIEEKNKLLLPIAEEVVEVTQQAGRRMLTLAKHFYSPQQKVKYVGEDNVQRVLAFESADIQTDLEVVGEPEYFQSAAASRAKVLEYVQTGVLDPINNPEDKESVLKVLAFGRADEAIAERLMDEDNQEREIQEMHADPDKYVRPSRANPNEQVPDYPIQPFDDDQVHIRSTIRHMKTDTFRKADPKAKVLIQNHLQDHQERYQAQVERQMQMQAMQRGGPGEKGQASQPKRQAATSGA
jgi:hypothetical protein